ncbi:terpenoid synthase [Annulohypoxylon moriforme]|nr:terpenoid synthase [Annulohypoxylon moriforme]
MPQIQENQAGLNGITNGVTNGCTVGEVGSTKLVGTDNAVKDDKELMSNTDLAEASRIPVMAPFEYLCSLPSKGVRNKLVEAINVWVKASSEDLETITSIVGDVHNLSLMLDDVQDSSPLRRGQPATHVVFGVPQTVNSATYQIVDVIGRSMELQDGAFSRIVIDEMRSLLIGQGVDLFWTHDVSSPPVEEYLQMVDGKTGGLFRMISKLMVARSRSSSKPPHLDRLMTLFGRLFQIRDDYANLVSDQYTGTKGFCEDLDEGKCSFILIKTLEMASPRQRAIMRSLLMERQATKCVGREHKNLLLTIMEDSGSLRYTSEVLSMLCDEVLLELRHVEHDTGIQNPAMIRIIESLRL